jgi:hypothetical protein
MRDALRLVIVEAVPELRRHCRDPWHVIGSAAVRLAGADATVADLDLLTSAADADRLAEAWAARRESAYRPAGADRFRSRFGRYRFAAMPVEVMGALELDPGDGWQPVTVGEATIVRVDGIDVPVPTIAEQIRILESFGRPKDLERAALLRALDHDAAAEVTATS